MNKQRNIITWIVIMLIAVLCIGFANAEELQATFNYNGKEYVNGGTIEKAYFYQDKINEAEIMEIWANIPDADHSSANSRWQIDDPEQLAVVEIVAEDSNAYWLTLQIKGPGFATIHYVEGNNVLATININLTLNVEELRIGTKLDVSISVPGDKIVYQFKPETDGNYCFRVLQDYEAFSGKIYNSKFEMVSEGSRYWTGRDTFTLEGMLNAGETYYYIIGYWSEYQTGSFHARLTPIKDNNLEARATSEVYFEEEDLEADAAVTLSVSVTADDMDGIIFTWQKYGYDANGNWCVETIEDATTATYEAKNITRSTHYNCYVYDAYGNIRSVYFIIEFNHLDVKVVGSREKLVEKNSTTVLEVKATYDRGNIRYVWRKNNDILENETNASIVTDPITEFTKYYCYTYDDFGNLYELDFDVRLKPDLSNVDSLVLNTPVTVTLAEEEKLYYQYTADETADYVFYSSDSNRNTWRYGFLYDSDLEELISTYYGGENGHFKMTFKLEKGKKYYLATRFLYEDESGSYNITLAKVPVVTFKVENGYWDYSGYSDYDDEDRIEILTYGYLEDDQIPDVGHNPKNMLYGVGSWDIEPVAYDIITESITYTYTYAEKEAQALTLDQRENVEIETEGDTILFKYTPTETGEYCFYSIAPNRTYGQLFDSEFNLLTARSDGWNFNLDYTLEAGKTYYYGARFDDDYITGGFIATLNQKKENHLSVTADKTVFNINPGESVSMSAVVTADDMDDLIYSWRIWGYDEVWNRYEYERAGTSATYNAENIGLTTHYTCYVYDMHGNYASVAFLSCVNNFSATHVGERERFVDANSQVTLEVDASCNEGPIYYQWSKNGCLLEDENEPTILTEAIKDYTSYTCEIHDDYGNLQHIDFRISLKPDLSGVNTLVLNTPVTVTLAEGKLEYFRFVPVVTGEYQFYATSNSDTYGFLYDGDMNRLVSVDDYDDDLDFRIIYTLEANKTYYYAAKYLDEEEEGTFTVTLTTNLAIMPVAHNVTFKVVNGTWDDGTDEDKTVTLSGYEGDILKLAETDIPAVGNHPNEAFKAGSWDVTPDVDTAITEDITFTYTYDEVKIIYASVTFKVVNGAWDDGTTEDLIVTPMGYEGDTLILSGADIPSVGSMPNDGYEAGSWDVTPVADTVITKDITYTYTYAAKTTISATVTFKVVNGAWDDGTKVDKTVTLSDSQGSTLKLAAKDIPAVGSKPGDTYKAGSWDVVPSVDTVITKDTTYTYSFVKKSVISAKVTFKVENGLWDDETSEDKVVTLSGYEGDTLKLAADQIPAVGKHPNKKFKAGSWNLAPSTEAAITADTTFTYTYIAKGTVSYTVTYIVVNGSWDDETTANKTTVVSGDEGDELKLTADQIPAVGSEPDKGFKAGTWDVEPSTETVITADTTYTYTYAARETIKATVTFKVVNGLWNDGTDEDIIVELTGFKGNKLRLKHSWIPKVGKEPAENYMAGSWDVVPDNKTQITEDTVYTYTYEREPLTIHVTFKVENGEWNNGTNEDIVVELTGFKGDKFRLKHSWIPKVGKKPAKNYKAGEWDVTPDNKTWVTEDTVYTYTYEKMPICTVSFDAGEGSGTMKAQEVIKGEKYTLPECDFIAPAGKMFSKWDKGAPGKKITINEDTVIIAQWKKIPVKSDVTLLAKMKAGNKNTELNLSWTKVNGAQMYDVYFALNGEEFKLIESTESRSLTIKKLTNKKIYKAYVQARKKDGTTIGKASPTVYAIAGGSNSDTTNPESIKVKKTEVELKLRRTYMIKPTVTGVKAGKDVLKKGGLIRYFSSNSNIATVDKDGKVTPKAAGSCVIYVVASNGVRTEVKITVTR